MGPSDRSRTEPAALPEPGLSLGCREHRRWAHIACTNEVVLTLSGAGARARPRVLGPASCDTPRRPPVPGKNCFTALTSVETRYRLCFLYSAAGRSVSTPWHSSSQSHACFLLGIEIPSVQRETERCWHAAVLERRRGEGRQRGGGTGQRAQDRKDKRRRHSGLDTHKKCTGQTVSLHK